MTALTGTRTGTPSRSTAEAMAASRTKAVTATAGTMRRVAMPSTAIPFSENNGGVGEHQHASHKRNQSPKILPLHRKVRRIVPSRSEKPIIISGWICKFRATNSLPRQLWFGELPFHFSRQTPDVITVFVCEVDAASGRRTRIAIGPQAIEVRLTIEWPAGIGVVVLAPFREIGLFAPGQALVMS